MPIAAIILTVAAIVAFITGSTVIGIICAVLAIGLFGYAYTQSGAGHRAGRPG